MTQNRAYKYVKFEDSNYLHLSRDLELHLCVRNCSQVQNGLGEFDLSITIAIRSDLYS